MRSLCARVRHSTVRGSGTSSAVPHAPRNAPRKFCASRPTTLAHFVPHATHAAAQNFARVSKTHTPVPHPRRRGVAGGAAAMKGVRVYSWSSLEVKAFEGFAYEAKKLAQFHFDAIKSGWWHFWPIMIGTYGMVKWAEEKNHHDHLHERD